MKVIVKGMNRIRGLESEMIEVKMIALFEEGEEQTVETGVLGDTIIHIILPDNFKEHLGDRGKWLNFTPGLSTDEINDENFKNEVIRSMGLYVDKQKRILEDANRSLQNKNSI